MLASKRFFFKLSCCFIKYSSGTLQQNPQKSVFWLMELREPESTTKEHMWKQRGPLHRCDCCVVWSICGIPGNGNRYCCWCFICLLGIYSSTGLSCPVWIQGKVLGFMAALIGHALLPFRGGLSLSEWLWRKDILEETEGRKR